MLIRSAQPSDAAGVYDVCLRTGSGGADATGLYEDPQLLGSVFAGPYLRLEPHLAFVLVDDAGVAGYVLGTADTTAFERRCEREWWPALRARHPEPPAAARNTWSPQERLLHRIHHPPSTPRNVAVRFPAHLHVDLLPRAQGTGAGRRLLATLFAALRNAGSPGVHLGVSRSNTRAVGFYRHLGFAELDVPGTDSGTLLMARDLDRPSPHP